MTTAFLPFVSSTFGAAAEALTLAAQVLAIVAALRWLAGLVQLTVMLVCSVIGDVAPLVGRHLGRYAGSAFRLGRQARRWYDRNAAPTVTTVLVHVDRQARAFVTKQLGTAYPALTAAIAPTAPMPSEAPSSPVETHQPAPTTASTPHATADLTRRQLLALAKTRKVRGYSRMNTDQLRQALIA